MEASDVHVIGVTKRYGTVTAVDDVTLSVEAGEFFALLGPSGSGKSTLLRLIAGFIHPDAGEIRVGGERIDHLPAHRRDIGMVFQHYALFPHMTVAENVAFGLDVRRVPKREKAKRVRDILSLVRLDGLENRRPSQLSGGQQQRVALARALVIQPRVLLLDEPLAALDKSLRMDMQEELKQLQRDVGITTIFVTHDQEEALTLAHRIAIMNEGRIVQVDESIAVYERPRTTFVAAFLGRANIFSGTAVQWHDGKLAVRQDDGGLFIATGPEVRPGEPVTVAVRPEKMRLEIREADRVHAGATAAASSPERPLADLDPAAGVEEGEENRIAGVIASRTFSGAGYTYHVQAGLLAISVFSQNEAGPPLPEGAPVDVVWPAAHMFVLEE